MFDQFRPLHQLAELTEQMRANPRRPSVDLADVVEQLRAGTFTPLGRINYRQ